MSYSRSNPGPRFVELQQLYRTMHEKGETFRNLPPERTYPGHSLPPQAGRIKRLIAQTKAETILDYGSGKGLQYEPRLVKDDRGGQWPSIADYWDIDEVVCYDPCYAPYSRLPSGKFDGVISTDVLEHCPEEDIPWIVEEIFGFATRFVFANVACFPALARLPTGENAHCTIKPVEWWSEILEDVTRAHPGLIWEVWVQFQSETPGGPNLLERKIGNS